MPNSESYPGKLSLLVCVGWGGGEWCQRVGCNGMTLHLVGYKRVVLFDAGEIWVERA